MAEVPSTAHVYDGLEDPAPGPLVCAALEAIVGHLRHDTPADLESLCDLAPDVARRVIDVLRADSSPGPPTKMGE